MSFNLFITRRIFTKIFIAQRVDLNEHFYGGFLQVLLPADLPNNAHRQRIIEIPRDCRSAQRGKPLHNQRFNVSGTDGKEFDGHYEKSNSVWPARLYALVGVFQYQ